MSHTTVEVTTYETYLDEEFPVRDVGCAEGRAHEGRERQTVIDRFPYAVVLTLAYLELDVSNRWCWRQFGPADGLCLEHASALRACDLVAPHSHEGRWRWRWLAKTDYNFGYSEWYFLSDADRIAFLEFIARVNRGEIDPK